MKIGGLAIAAMVLLLAACGSRAKPVSEKKISVAELRPNFKYKNLREFRIDTFGWDTRRDHYPLLDQPAHDVLIQFEKRPFSPEYEPEFFYSWQERDTGFHDCTVLYQDENGYCTVLKYLIFDKQGKALGAFTLATKCGDAEWTCNSDGHFIRPDTYHLTTVETNMVGMDTLDHTELIDIDSVIDEYQIQPDGTVREREVLRRQYQRKVCCYQEEGE